MSRTDKDRPYHIADRYEADHYCLMHKNVECDIPPYPTKNIHTAHHVGYPRRIIRPEGVPEANWGTRCTWEPVLPLNRVKWWRNAAPKWYVDHFWNNPERVRIRDEGRKAAADYRANGNTEWDIENRQTRSSAIWSYW